MQNCFLEFEMDGNLVVLLKILQKIEKVFKLEMVL